ncbi:MAG TPA: BON domain-containing protein [Waddliaceae bacterium]
MKKILTLAALGSISFLSAATCQYGNNQSYQQSQDRGYYNQRGGYQGRNWQQENDDYDNSPGYDKQPKTSQQNYNDNPRGYYRSHPGNYNNQQGYYRNSQNNWGNDNQQGYNDNRQNRSDYYSNQGYPESRKNTYGSSSQDSQMNAAQDSAANDTDQQLNAKIREKLSGARIKGYETLVFRTNNGVVIISGAVESPEDVQKINEKLKDLKGIKSLKNQVMAKQQQKN